MQKKVNILIVDDNENIRETMSDILQEKGYRTQTAKTGDEAIRESKTKFFNIALIDIDLPDMTGIEVLQNFRQEHPHMMNIMITGHSTKQNAVDALNLGANAYIMKPIDFRRLEDIMNQCLKKQQEASKITEERVAEFMEKTLVESK